MTPPFFAIHLGLLLSIQSPNSDAITSSRGRPLEQSATAALTTEYRFAPPPWSFVASRIHYQFRLIRADTAAPTVPRPSDEAAGVSLLSLGGWTLGGLFAVEYESSPVGPYREVAVLSGLVARGLWPIGAWASHIFVYLDDAAEAGREIWGLPASVFPIDFEVPLVESSSTSGAGGEEDGTRPDFLFSEEGVRLRGCPPRRIDEGGKHDNDLGLLRSLEVSLPSYSGRLVASDPLLRYPLTVQGPETVYLSQAGTVSYGGMDKELQCMLERSLPLFTVNVGKVRLTAGIPHAI